MDNKPRISVITVTNRHGGVDITWSALKRQTFKDFEWVFGDTLYEKRKEAVKDYTKSDGRVKHYKQGAKDPVALTWLNHAENEAIKVSAGELIVLLQDYINIAPDALEKFWYQYKADPKCYVSGVGHQYGKPGKDDVVNLEGLITVFEKPFEEAPSVVVWTDPRMKSEGKSFYPCMPNDWEANFCMAPRQMFYDVGGFDEEYDYVGHAWDNCSVSQRAFALGYEPYIDQTNISKSIRNDDFFDTSVKENNWQDIATFHTERMREISEGKLPIKYHYLDIVDEANNK